MKSKTILMVFSALVLLSQLAMGQLFVGLSFSQENTTNAVNETGAILCGNHTNQTGGGPLEQVGEALGGVFGGGENQSQYLESSPSPFFQYAVKNTGNVLFTIPEYPSIKKR